VNNGFAKSENRRMQEEIIEEAFRKRISPEAAIHFIR
jgi:hypothetical protein